jgi:response regulator NasT
VQAGVSAYVVDGIQPHRVRPIVEAAIARFEKFRALEDELQRTRAELADRKVIEKAKGLIMRQRGVSEDEAYRAMRKVAMRSNRRLADVAEGIVAAAELLI